MVGSIMQVHRLYFHAPVICKNLQWAGLRFTTTTPRAGYAAAKLHRKYLRTIQIRSMFCFGRWNVLPVFLVASTREFIVKVIIFWAGQTNIAA